MEKKYDVILNYSACAGASNGGVEPLHCGSMTMEQIKQYLQELATKKTISPYSCPNHFTAHFENKESLSVYLSHHYDCPDTPSKETKGCLNLYMTNHASTGIYTSKCYYRDCFNNIKNGKCTDAFIIETIGKKFFADKYKDKQK